MPAEQPRPLIGFLTRNIKEENNKLIVSGLCVVKFSKSKEVIDTGKIRIDVPVRKDAAKVSFGSRFGVPGPKGYRLNSCRMEFDIDELRDFDIQNKLLVVYDDKDGNENVGRVLYSAADMRHGKNKNSEIFIHDDFSVYFRQNIHNTTFLTVRDTNQYDYPEGQERIRKAHANAAKLKDNDIVLLYEKKCQKYEESASVLYEKLIDMGYDNAYFIVDKSIPAIQDLPEKYKKNLIDKDSDKHLEYFFASNRFISTETIEHALQLRIANKYAQDKINKNTGDLMYVFLQHGPTYMVSLNMDLRNGFRKKTDYKLHKTVVSSQLEAEHFIERGGMTEDDLYITGMAKFDRAFRHEGADRIVIMPTWRRWEMNQARDDITQTNYYKMMRLMYDSVPEELKDKVIVLPHPLMAERFEDISKNDKGKDAEMCRRILVTDSYENVLRDTEVLITDYSSISYDAFYRGAKVVFYWAEKDECMTHYGENTKLMLNLDNVFGPVAMNGKEIAAAVRDNYGKEQRPDYLERYRKIIEFHDGKNTERIIEHLIEDGVIERKA
ncbi:MAG: CDP-glycerol glycerophosphotransferase family protein [Mogibacterium sp.]|nr:CDP-glycerol glycerophosphotransferase family protein [Mogibacterium sp.]